MLKTRIRTLVISLASLLFVSLSGCGPVIGLIVDAMPKPDIPAEYDTSGNRVAVFVNSTGNSELSAVFKRELTNQLNVILYQNDAAISTVDYSDISDLILLTSEIITPEVVGREFDIDLIINIQIERFSIDYRNTEKMSPGQMLCFVSVVEADTCKRLWPTEQIYKTISVVTSLDHDSQEHFSNSLIQTNLAEQAADTIGKLFYKHKQ